MKTDWREHHHTMAETSLAGTTLGHNIVRWIGRVTVVAMVIGRSMGATVAMAASTAAATVQGTV